MKGMRLFSNMIGLLRLGLDRTRTWPKRKESEDQTKLGIPTTDSSRKLGLLQILGQFSVPNPSPPWILWTPQIHTVIVN